MHDTRLYIVATPIGNLGDISQRARDVLNSADIIAAEDTRNSRKLMTHFEISTPMTSYHEYNSLLFMRITLKMTNSKKLLIL